MDNNCSVLNPVVFHTLFGEVLLPVVDITLSWLNLNSYCILVLFKEFDLNNSLTIETFYLITLFSVIDSIRWDSESDMLLFFSRLIIIHYIVGIIITLVDSPFKFILLHILLDVVEDSTWLHSGNINIIRQNIIIGNVGETCLSY